MKLNFNSIAFLFYVSLLLISTIAKHHRPQIKNEQKSIHTLQSPEEPTRGESHRKIKFDVMQARFKSHSLKHVDMEFEKKFNMILNNNNQGTTHVQNDDEKFGAKTVTPDNLQQIEEDTYRKILESDTSLSPSLLNVDVSSSLDLQGSNINLTPPTDNPSLLNPEGKSQSNAMANEEMNTQKAKGKETF